MPMHAQNNTDPHLPGIGLNMSPAGRIASAEESEVLQSAFRDGLIVRFHHLPDRLDCSKHGVLVHYPPSNNTRSAASPHQQWCFSNRRISEAQATTTQFRLSAMRFTQNEMCSQSCPRQMREVSSLPSFLLRFGSSIAVRLLLGELVDCRLAGSRHPG